MLQHTHTEKFIKARRANWNIVNTGLEKMQVRRGMIFVIGVHGVTQIEGVKFGASLERKLGKAARAATCFQNSLTLQICRPTGSCIPAIPAEIVAHDLVELDAVVTIPLESEICRIVFRWHEPRNPADNGNTFRAAFAFEPSFDNFAGFLARDFREAKRIPASGADQ